MITADQVEQAREQLETARAEVSASDLAIRTHKGEATDEMISRAGRATSRFVAAERRLDQMEQDHAAEQAALAARTEREAAAQPVLDAAAAELAARDGAVRAAEEACRRAELALSAAVGEREAAWSGLHRLLVEHELTLEAGTDHASGAGFDACRRPNLLRHRGTWSRPLRPVGRVAGPVVLPDRPYDVLAVGVDVPFLLQQQRDQGPREDPAPYTEAERQQLLAGLGATQ
jgi:hypothetical protein